MADQRPDSVVPGDRLGIFRITYIDDRELICGEEDSHLDFRVSLFKKDNAVILTTQVSVNNLLGKVYMFVITPFHKAIIRSALTDAVDNRRI